MPCCLPDTPQSEKLQTSCEEKATEKPVEFSLQVGEEEKQDFYDADIWSHAKKVFYFVNAAQEHVNNPFSTHRLKSIQTLCGFKA